MKMKRDPFMLITALACLVMLVLLWAGTLFGPAAFDSARLSRHDPRAFDAGWQRLAADGSRAAISLPAGMKAEPYEPVTLVNTIPEAYQGSTLLFRSEQQEVAVSLDGEPIYAYGELGSHRFIKTVPSHWNIVELPAHAGGGEIRVTLTSAYPDISGYVKGFWLGDYAQCLGFINSSTAMGMVLSVVILFLGLFYLCAAFLMSGRRFKPGVLLYWSLFTLLAGVWSLGAARVDQFLFVNPYIMWMATYVALLLLPLPIYYYIYISSRDAELRRVVNPLITINIGIIIICLLLQLFGAYDLWEMRLAARGLVVVCMVVFLWSGLAAAVDMTSALQRVRAVVIILAAITTFTAAVFLYDEQEALVGNSLRLAIIIIVLLWGMISLRRTTQEARAASRLRAEIKAQQLLVMASQIRPHFIYNTLGAIHGQISAAPELAEEMVYSFSKYLRANIDAVSGTGTIPFARELEHIKNYARIEELRFIGRVGVEYDIETDEFELPPLTVQPLVENAIKHGICKKREGGTVWVRTREEPGAYVIRVEDDGVGFAPEDIAAAAGSSGIRNIRFRLEAMMGGTVEIGVRPGGGTVAVVRIPRSGH
ncbi:MAG: histidine kinase [Syntrophomonadaceae bacterium]|nr:histidine kinase [Syntrophomonadaceae bacterium]